MPVAACSVRQHAGQPNVPPGDAGRALRKAALPRRCARPGRASALGRRACGRAVDRSAAGAAPAAPASSFRGTVAVTGASGYVARSLRAALHRAGCRAACVSRRPLRGLLPSESAFVSAGYDAGELEAAFEGCSALVHLAGAGRIGGASGASPYSESNEGVALRAARACRAAGVGRAVYLSGLGASARAATSYFASKYAAERALASHVRQCTVLRPSFIVGSFGGGGYADPLSRGLARQARRHGAILVPGSGPHKTQPVHIADACAAVLSALSGSRLAGRTADLVGPRAVPYRRLARLLAPPGAPLRTVPLADAYRAAVADRSYAYGTDDLNILVGGFTGDHARLRRLSGLPPFVDVLCMRAARGRLRPGGRRPGRSAPTRSPRGQSGRTRPSRRTRAS